MYGSYSSYTIPVVHVVIIYDQSSHEDTTQKWVGEVVELVESAYSYNNRVNSDMKSNNTEKISF